MRYFPHLFLFFLLLGSFAGAANAKTVRYELTITKQKYNVTGKDVDFALTVNGGIPAPTLEFTEGDEAEILVKNRLSDDEVSIHWHGILLPPEMDGVPYVSTPPIFPGKDHLFKFTLRQHGTYWYHSHTNVQEQKGVYGALVIHPKKPTIKADREVVAVLSDWSDEDAAQILKNLHKDGDYYLYKKGTLRSWSGAAKAGALKTYLGNEWTRMGGMDLSDVGYDAFLINGKKDLQLADAKAGETVRLRLINASASTYFYVSLGSAPMTVISADGVDIEPVQAQELLMGMAETYDVLFKVPENKNYELKISAQDGTGGASGWIGRGEKVAAPARARPDLYAPMNHSMDHSGHSATAPNMDHSQMNHEEMDHGDMDHSEMSHEDMDSPRQVKTLQVDDIKALTKASPAPQAPRREFKLVLDGDMRRYVWHINGKAIHEDMNIFINTGDVVRFVYVNNSMMHHPMHLHGHFFRVLNQFGDYSPLKHTVDVPPHGTRTIEFVADEPGHWMLHCHNLYHLKTGMARVVKYTSFTPLPEVARWQARDPHLHDHWYTYGRLSAATNAAEGLFRVSQTWNEFKARVESRSDREWESEGDVFYRRWLGKYLNLAVGASYDHEETRAQVGIGYLLPLLVESNIYADNKGKLRVDLAKKFQWTDSLFSEAEFIWREDKKFDNDLALTLMYQRQWNWAVGIKYTGRSWGAGFQYQF